MKEKAVNALRESEEKYRRLIEASEDFVFALDLEGKFTFGNTKAVETFGDLKGKPFTIPVLPEYHELVKKNFARRIKREKVEPYRIGVVDKEGNKLWVEVSGSPLVRDGKIVGAVYFQKNITDQKKLEQELRDVLDAAPDAIHVLSPDMRIIRRNAASEKLFPKLQVGNHCYEALHGRKEPCEHCGVVKVFKDGERHEHESTIKHPDGKVTVVHSPSAPVFDGEGNVIAAVEVLRDITERKKAEVAVKRSEEKYRRLVESVEKRHFLYSHGTDGVFTYLSPSIEAILGYTPKEFMTHYTTYLTPSPVNKEVERHTELSIKGIQQPPYEVEIYHKNGSIRWLSVSESPVFNDTGEVIAVEGIAHDITQRKEAEMELRRSKVFNETVLNSMNDAVSIIDVKTFKIVGANQIFFEQLGLREVEVIGKPCYEITHHRDSPCTPPEDMCPLLETLDTGKHSVFEHVHYQKDGGKVYVEVSASPIEDENGKVIQVVHVARDITERKKAEQALMESEGKFRTLTEKSLVGVYLIQDGVFKYVNPKLAEIFGYTVGELIDKKGPRDLVLPEDWPTVEGNLRKRLTGEIESIHYDFRGMTKNKKTVYVDVYGSQTSFHGRPAVIGTLLDITERKSAEKAILRSVKELKTINEIDRNIITKPDLSSLLKFIVRKARGLTGADAAFYSSIEGDVLRHHTFSGIRTRAFKNIRLTRGTGLGWLVLEEKRPVAVEDFSSDKRLKNAPHDTIMKEGLVSVLAVPFFSGKGEPTGVLYVANRRTTKFTDEQERTLITLAGQVSVAVEHARLQERTKKAYKELMSLDELKSNIIANVSHELRTPITIAKGALELAVEEEDKNKRNKLLEMVVSALGRQNLIIGDLIEAARMKSRETKESLEDVSISKAINSATVEFMPIAVRKGIKLGHSINGDLPVVKANYKRLEHVLRNLLSNALKFTDKSGEVRVEAKVMGENVVVCVADTGIGIPREYHKRIFERLYQIDSSGTRHYGGTGMGLAIAKETIEALGGRITVESEPGEGSRFCFTLPISREIEK